MIDRNKVHQAEKVLRSQMEWMRWVEEIPYVQWPEGWQVKAAPPFSGAVVRYLVTRDDIPFGDRVSVYLDCYAILSAESTPYWEVYPGDNGSEPDRCDMHDIEELKRQIKCGLDHLRNNYIRSG
jgi:hypothetical protein